MFADSWIVRPSSQHVFCGIGNPSDTEEHGKLQGWRNVYLVIVIVIVAASVMSGTGLLSQGFGLRVPLCDEIITLTG